MYNCVITCLLASGFMGSMIYSFFSVNKTKIMNDFNNLLNIEQRNIYNKIKEERLRLYVEGYLIGLIVSLLIVFKLDSIGRYERLCLFVVIAIGINIVYYLSYPKSDYMLKHLETKEQNKAWLTIYRTMRNRYLFGFIMGVMAYIILGLNFCKN